MKVIHKDAAVTAPVDDQFPGTFEAILSAPTKDRDGDTLLPGEWKQPLPEHITVDIDHEMTVAGTIGSARPWIDEAGNLRISGKFASTARAQEVRTLMQEGHINRTSVAFLSEKTQKDGVSSTQRELLNAAIVAIPSNREAVVLDAKGATSKAGARNAKSDQEHIDAIAAHALALGARTPGDKSGGDTDADQDVAAAKSVAHATVKQAADLFATVDTNRLPAAIKQGIALVKAAASDEPGDVVSTPEDAETGAPEPAAAGAADAAPAAVEPEAPAADSTEKQLAAVMQRAHENLRRSY